MYMEDREWEAIKQSEDKRMKEILGLEDYGQKMTDITKESLNTIWIKRKLNKKGQKNREENQKPDNGYVVLLGYVHWREHDTKVVLLLHKEKKKKINKQSCLAVKLAVMVMEIKSLLICLSDQIAIIL